MKNRFFTLIILLIILFLSINLIAQPYTDLLPNYNRTKSRVMVRKITQPTLATLDFAAYYANPIRFDSEKFSPKKPPHKITLSEMVFGNSLTNAVGSIKLTPLTDAEKVNPVSYTALQNLLWKELKIDALNSVIGRITSEKWADPDIFKPYQEVAALYIHKADTITQLWVEIEFSPWVAFLQGIIDDDKDGVVEIFGRLNTDSIDKGIMSKIIAWIQADYTQKLLSREQIVDWANILASYWYPTLNTDIVDMTGSTQWPTDQTEKDIKGQLKGFKAINPVAVIRGNPLGKPLYNVFIVEGLTEAKKVTTTEALNTSVPLSAMDTAVSENFRQNTIRFTDEVKPFGDYASWYSKNASILDQQKKILGSVPPAQMGIPGKDHWLFFRKSLEYMMAEDLGKQPEDKNPLTNLVVFKKYLDSKNINMLFVAVPSKEEVYYEKLGIETADKSSVALINPYGRKILRDLQDAGIEVIDLLPLFLNAKKDDPKSSEPLYQLHDTHWTNRGLQIAAHTIAGRIKQYSWYKDLEKQKVAYTVKDTSFERLGDIIERVSEMEKNNYKPSLIFAQQVYTPANEPYKGTSKDPIMLIGDSFTGVFELVDCKSAGVGSHIAAKIGVPVDIITSWGGGPMIINKIVRIRKNELGSKKLLIYMMTDRDLYNYAQGWEKLKTD